MFDALPALFHSLWRAHVLAQVLVSFQQCEVFNLVIAPIPISVMHMIAFWDIPVVKLPHGPVKPSPFALKVIAAEVI